MSNSKRYLAVPVLAALLAGAVACSDDLTVEEELTLANQLGDELARLASTPAHPLMTGRSWMTSSLA